MTHPPPGPHPGQASTPPGAAPRPALSRATVAALLTAAIAALLVTASCTPRYPDELDPQPNSGTLAKSLMRANKENPVRFQLEHAGDTVQATGTVRFIHPDGRVTFEAHWGNSLVCAFTDQQQVSSMDKKDTITFSGEVDIPTRYRAYLTRCQVLEHRPH